MADDPDKPVFKADGFTTGIVAEGLSAAAAFPAPPPAVVCCKGFLDGPHVVYHKKTPPPPPPASEYAPADGVFRLYLDDTFAQWLEFGVDAIVAQVTIPPNLSDPRSIVWLDRNATVTKCVSGDAATLADGEGADSAAGPNRPRRPPY
ncbi:MAG: hypothetical protein ABIM89_09575 [Mycobacteriales bacterium]